MNEKANFGVYCASSATDRVLKKLGFTEINNLPILVYFTNEEIRKIEKEDCTSYTKINSLKGLIDHCERKLENKKLYYPGSNKRKFATEKNEEDREIHVSKR